MPLVPCRACGCHHFSVASTCPACGASVHPGPAAAVLGLALASSCAPVAQPLYGATVTDYTDTEVESDTGTAGDTSDTGTP